MTERSLIAKVTNPRDVWAFPDFVITPCKDGHLVPTYWCTQWWYIAEGGGEQGQLPKKNPKYMYLYTIDHAAGEQLERGSGGYDHCHFYTKSYACPVNDSFLVPISQSQVDLLYSK